MTVNTDNLTTKSLTGTGVIDVLMETTRLHLQREFDESRIRGNDYSTAYVNLMGSVIQGAIQYALQQPVTEQQALKLEAEVTNIEAELPNIQLQDDLTQEQISLLVAQILKANAEKALLDQKKVTEQAQTDDAGIDSGSVIGKQLALYTEQTTGYRADRAIKGAKLYTDVASVQLNINEQYSVPTGLADAAINSAMSKVSSNT